MAFNQVRALERNDYGQHGEFVCFDVHPFRTTKVEHWLATWTTAAARSCACWKRPAALTRKKRRPSSPTAITQRLDQMVLEHLMGR